MVRATIAEPVVSRIECATQWSTGERGFLLPTWQVTCPCIFQPRQCVPTVCLLTLIILTDRTFYVKITHTWYA